MEPPGPRFTRQMQLGALSLLDASISTNYIHIHCNRGKRTGTVPVSGNNTETIAVKGVILS